MRKGTTMTTSQLTTGDAAGAERAGLGIFAKLSYFLMLLGVVGLGASGIGTFVLGQAPMTHWILMAHVGLSPMFSVGLALVALTWPARTGHHRCVSRGLLWLVLLTGLVVILSGVLPMTPVADTEGQHALYLVHRYAGMVVAVLVPLHLLSMIGRK